MPWYNVKPSDILYPSVSITNKFKNGLLIREVLDDILDGSLYVKDIPMIEVKLVTVKTFSLILTFLIMIRERPQARFLHVLILYR